MKNFKPIVVLLTLLFFENSTAQYSAIRSAAKKVSRYVVGEVGESGAKRGLSQGVKKVSKESFDLGLNKVSKEFIGFTTQKSLKGVTELIQANSKKSITKTLSVLQRESLGNSSSLKVLRKTSSSVLKMAIRSDLKSYAAKNGFKLVANKRSISVLSKSGTYLGRIYQKGSKKVINVGSGFLKKSTNSNTKYIVNPILDAPLPNAVYKVENTRFVTDKYSRTILAETKSFSKNIVNRDDVIKGKFKRSLNGGLKGDHDGHLIAHSLGGNYGKLNLVSQKGSLNVQKYASIENFARKNKGVVKNYGAKPYFKGKSLRPETITQIFEFGGDLSVLKDFIKTQPALTYKTTISATGKKLFNCIVEHIN